MQHTDGWQLQHKLSLLVLATELETCAPEESVTIRNDMKPLSVWDLEREPQIDEKFAEQLKEYMSVNVLAPLDPS